MGSRGGRRGQLGGILLVVKKVSCIHYELLLLPIVRATKSLP